LGSINDGELLDQLKHHHALKGCGALDYSCIKKTHNLWNTLTEEKVRMGPEQKIIAYFPFI
jgi:hypothetical protein